MSYDFDASSRYMQGSLTTQRDSEGLSIVAWIKCTAAQWASTSQTYCAVIGEDLTTTYDNSQFLTKTNGAADRVTASSQTTTTQNAAHSFTDGTYDSIWVCVTATFTSDTRRDVYIESTSNTASNTGTRAVGTALDTIRIGSSASGYSNFLGLIAEVAFYDKVLSASEINSLQTGAGTGPAPNTVATANCFAYYPMDYNNSTQTNEGSDATGDLTVTGAVYSSDHPIITSSSSIAPLAYNHYMHSAR